MRILPSLVLLLLVSFLARRNVLPALMNGQSRRGEKVTVRFQVTIPAEVRPLLKIKEGQTLVFAEENGRVYVVGSQGSSSILRLALND